MKPLDTNEIFENLSGFLKSRGIELKDGSYAQGIQKSCALLTSAINLGQESLERAKTEFDKSMDHMRQVIHEKTAPKAPPKQPAPPPAEPKVSREPQARSKPAKARSAARKSKQAARKSRR